MLFVVGVIITVEAEIVSSRLKTSSQEEGRIKFDCNQAEGFCIKRGFLPVKGISYVQE